MVSEAEHQLAPIQTNLGDLEGSLEVQSLAYRELKHRIANDLQLILSTVRLACRKVRAGREAEFAEDVHSKVFAVAEAFRLMNEAVGGLRRAVGRI
jgi:two-component sensor histidine kinase